MLDCRCDAGVEEEEEEEEGARALEGCVEGSEALDCADAGLEALDDDVGGAGVDFLLGLSMQEMTSSTNSRTT